MAFLTAQIKRPSPFGPAVFSVSISETGEVLSVIAAATKLPENVFKLTYGDRWEDARAYFLDHAANVAFQTEVALHLEEYLGFEKIAEQYRQAGGEHFRPTDRAYQTGEPDYRARARYWITRPRELPILFLEPDTKRYASLQRIVQRFKRKPRAELPYAASLESWVFSLLGVARGKELDEAVTLLGRVQTTAAREYVFAELERPGRHIVAGGLLRGLAAYQDAAARDRILDLYPKLVPHDDLTPIYLEVISQLKGEAVVETGLQMLRDRSLNANGVLALLRYNEHPDPVGVVRQQFDRETEYFFLNSLLNTINQQREATHHVSLQDLNAKIAGMPEIIDSAPVTWPQQLEPNWKTLLLATDQSEALRVIEAYILQPSPRLQRNALLQLKALVKEEQLNTTISAPLEERLRELIYSRFDKISTVALDIVAELFPLLAKQATMVDVILAHSLTSRYRLMNTAALKVAARDPALKKRQIAFYQQAVEQATDSNTATNLMKVIPYLSFLGVKEDLTDLLQKRKFS
ncbi:MAG: hypothetical protein AAF840_02555 [Bacteroidota bacterium]